MLAEHVNNQVATPMNRTIAVNTLALLGDEINALGFMFCHSTVYWNLVAQEQINFIVPSEIDTTLGGPDGQIPTYMGKIVIVDDTVPNNPATPSYTTYFAGAGAIGYGEAALAPEDALKTDEDILAGTEIMAHRRVFILHPFGVRYSGAPAGSSATNAELEAGASWARVYERRNVRLAAAITAG